VTVRFDGLSFRYPGSDRDALREVSVSLGREGITLVTGRLGSGCSTLLLAAAGLAPHVTGGTRQGMVTTLGHDPASVEGRRALAGRLGLLLPTPWTQLSGMSYTVWEEVGFGPANLGWSRDRIGEAVQRALAHVQAQHLESRDPRTLSGGELQRVMLAAVTATDPEVLLLDEPALELDPAGARLLYDLLPALATERTVVVASTDVDRAVEVANHALFLDRGSLVAEGSPAEVLGSPSAVVMGASTTVAGIARSAGMDAPFPVNVAAAVGRLAS